MTSPAIATTFWLAGGAFFAVQAAMLVHLLRERRKPCARVDGSRRDEIVWTLVPAAFLAALGLMVGGLTQGSWSRVRGIESPLAATEAQVVRISTGDPAGHRAGR